MMMRSYCIICGSIAAPDPQSFFCVRHNTRENFRVYCGGQAPAAYCHFCGQGMESPNELRRMSHDACKEHREQEWQKR